MAKADERESATAPASCAWPPPSTRSGFVFDPGGLTARAVGELSDGKQAGRGLAEARGRAAAPSRPTRSTVLRQHALANPILVDLTADDTTPLVLAARRRGHGRRARQQAPAGRAAAASEELWQRVAAANQRMLTEATVGAGLPIFDSYRKLVESGDRVLKIEGCLSGTLGFVLTEVERGQVVLAGAARGDGEGLHRARSARRPVGRGRGPQGADPGAAARVRGRARRRRGRIAGARGAARARRATRSSPASATWTPTGRKRAAAAKAKGATLRYVASVSKDKIPVGLADREPPEPVLRPQGHRQPGRLHDPPLPEEPARDHRARAPAPPSPPPASSTTCCGLVIRDTIASRQRVPKNKARAT